MSDSEDIDPAEHALSMDELMTWLMKALKAWCSSQGLAVSAKRKEILAKRVYRAMHYGNSSSSNDESGDDVARQVPLPRLRPSTWKTAITDEIPPIRDSDITNYFIYHTNPRIKIDI